MTERSRGREPTDSDFVVTVFELWRRKQHLSAHMAKKYGKKIENTPCSKMAG